MNIRLIPYRRALLDAYFAWRNQPASVRHNPLKPMTIEEVGKMFETEGTDLSDLKKHENYRWFIEVDGEAVGHISLKNVNHMMGFAEIGYGVSETHHRKGIATEAVKILVAQAFEKTALRKLLAYVHDDNLASCRVLEKAGFRQEGLLREHYLINGKPENEAVFGLLRHEWVDCF